MFLQVCVLNDKKKALREKCFELIEHLCALDSPSLNFKYKAVNTKFLSDILIYSHIFCVD